MRKYEDLFLAFWVVRIREFRTKMNLSQEKLAEKLHVNIVDSLGHTGSTPKIYAGLNHSGTAFARTLQSRNTAAAAA